MHLINLKETETQLAQLIEIVANGEEVAIINKDGASFKIIPTIETKAIPKFGSAKGLIKMSDDFDDPLDDFDELDEFEIMRLMAKSKGYDSQEKIMELIKQVKLEILEEKGTLN